MRSTTNFSILALLLGLATIFSLTSLTKASAQCTSCDQTINLSGSLNSTTNVFSSNVRVCFTGTGTYNGNINGHNGSNINICVGPGVTFSSSVSINNISGGANIENSGTFNVSNLTISSGKSFTNNSGASVSTSFNLESGGTINNAGTWSSSSFTFNGGSVNNTGTATITNSVTGNGNWSGVGNTNFNGGFSANSGTYNFGGQTYINGSMTIASSPTITFGGMTVITGSLTVNGGSTLRIESALNVLGSITNGGTITVPSTAGSCAALCSDGSFSNSGGTITTTTGKTMLLCKTPSPAGTISGGAAVDAPPVNAPTSLNLSVASGSVNGSFTAATGSPAATGYLVLRKVGSAFATSDYPLYGGTYSVGSVIGGATVIAINNSSTTTFTDPVSTCATNHYAVFSTGSASGSCGKNRRSTPLSSSVAVSTVGGTASGGDNRCVGDTPPTMSVSGIVGNVVKWQSSTTTTFLLATDIAHTGTTYTPATLPTTTTYYRAVVQLGSCATANSAHTTLTYFGNPTTTSWTGNSNRNSSICNNWSAGRPISTTNVTINGTTNTPRLDADLTVNNLSFGATNPATASIDLNGRKLTVNGTLTLAAGSVMNINNGTLELRGGVSGTGTLSGGADAELILAGTAGNVTVAFSGDQRVSELSIDKSGRIATINSNLTVLNDLEVTNGTLALGANTTLTLSGDIELDQPIRGATTANLVVNGSGEIDGNFTFAASYRDLASLTLNRSGDDFILGSALTVGGAVTITDGTICLNGNTLNINGAASLSGGFICSSSTSSLVFGGSGALSTIRFAVDNRIINNLTSTRTGQTLTLGTELTVNGTLNVSSLAIGANTLTVAGSVASTTMLRGSGSSNLTFTGTAASTLNFETGYQTLNQYTQTTGSAVVTLGSSLAIGATVNQTVGSFAIGANTLALNGNVTSIRLTGSNTSNLEIAGIGSLGTVNFLTGGRELRNLTLNRSGAVLALTNAFRVSGSLALTAGELDFSGITLTTDGAISGNGSLRSTSTSSLVVNGSGLNSTIRFTSGFRTINGITLNRSNGSLIIDNPLTLNGALTLTAGVVEMPHLLTMGSSASLSGENADNFFKGYLTVSRTALLNTNQLFGNIGIEIQAAGAAPGLTTVTRNTYDAPVGYNGNTGIRFAFTITPTYNTNLNATLRYTYPNNSWILNDKNVSRLCFWRSTNGGVTWEKRGYTQKEISTNRYTLANISSFSDWVLGNEDTEVLPVELLSFYGQTKGNQVKLFWSVATEINNAGYTVERSSNKSSWEPVGFVRGATNSQTVNQYELTAAGIDKGTYFRLVQTDLDGKRTEFSPIFLNPVYEGDLNLNMYPNPTTGIVNLGYHTLNDEELTISVMNQLGQVMQTTTQMAYLGSGILTLDLENMPKGIYTISAESATGFKFSKRLIKQ